MIAEAIMYLDWEYFMMRIVCGHTKAHMVLCFKESVRNRLMNEALNNRFQFQIIQKI